MKYKSPNGYFGVMEKGNFMGFKQWDLGIFNKDGKLVYRATLSDPMSHKDFKREVDDFPLTYEVLQSLNEEGEDEQ